MNRRYRAALVGLFALYAALYARTATYDLVWEDLPALVDNPLYEGPWLAGIRASRHDHVDSSQDGLVSRLSYDSYRPVTYLSHRWERELYGKSAAGHHLHNVFLGALAIALVLALARRWLAHDGKALAVAAAFALHPVQVESFAYVSARADLLAAVFALASLWLSLRGADQAGKRWPWLLASTVAFLLSVLSKEAYLGAPVALLLIGWSMGRPRAHLADVCAHALALALYFVVRSSIAPLTDGPTSAAAALILPGMWVQYLSISLAPTDLTVVRPLTTLWLIPGWLAFLAVVAGLGLASRGPLDSRMRLMRHALAGAAFALVLLAHSAIVARITGVIADRYACLPLVGYVIAVVSAGHWLAEILPSAFRPLRLLAAGLAVACLVVTAVQVTVWSNAKLLYMNALMIERHSSSAAYGLGLAHARTGNWAFAHPYFMHAVDLDPNNAKAWNNLAAGALQQRDYAGAIYAANRAVAMTDAPFRALHNLGAAHLLLGQSREGCAALARALHHNPANREARELQASSCASIP